MALFATSLTSLQASTWCLYFSPSTSCTLRGRESEELNAESGAAKSGWNGSSLCGGKRGNVKENPPLWEPFVLGVKALGLGDDSGCTTKAVASVLQRRWWERRVIVCMYAGYFHIEHKLLSYCSSPPGGWHSYLLRPLAILANKQFVFRTGLK